MGRHGGMKPTGKVRGRNMPRNIGEVGGESSLLGFCDAGDAQENGGQPRLATLPVTAGARVPMIEWSDNTQVDSYRDLTDNHHAFARSCQHFTFESCRDMFCKLEREVERYASVDGKHVLNHGYLAQTLRRPLPTKTAGPAHRRRRSQLYCRTTGRSASVPLGPPCSAPHRFGGRS
jgi:hypothetical protein